MKQNDKKISEKSGGKVLQGTVVSDKMQDTIVVAVNRFVKNKRYSKYQKVTKRYSVHCPAVNGTTVAVGDKVSIKETRPISKTKSFVLVQDTEKHV